MLYGLSQPYNQALFRMGILWVSSDDRVYQIPLVCMPDSVSAESSIGGPKLRHAVIKAGGNIKPPGLP